MVSGKWVSCVCASMVMDKVRAPPDGPNERTLPTSYSQIINGNQHTHPPISQPREISTVIKLRDDKA